MPELQDACQKRCLLARTAVGALLGAAVGNYLIGRARWRPVTIP